MDRFTKFIFLNIINLIIFLYLTNVYITYKDIRLLLKSNHYTKQLSSSEYNKHDLNYKKKSSKFYLIWCHHRRRGHHDELINSRANPPDLTICADLNFDIAHLHHRPPELDVEGETEKPSYSEEALHNSSGGVVAPQPLIGFENPAAVPQLGEVGGVEPVLAAVVECHTPRGVAAVRAEASERRQERRVDSGVGAAVGEVVQSVPEEITG